MLCLSELEDLRQCQRTREKEPDVRLTALLKIVDRCGGCGTACIRKKRKRPTLSFCATRPISLRARQCLPLHLAILFFLYFLFFYFRSRLQLFGVCWPDREISPLLVEPVSISGYRNTIHPSFGAWSRMCRLQTKPSKSTEQSLPRYYFPGALSRLSFFLMLQDLVYIRKSSLSWLAFSLLVRMTHQVEEETRLTACRSVPLRPMRRRVSSHRVALSSTCSLNEETIRETERKWIVAGREEGKRFADNWVVMMSSKRKEKTVKKLERTRRRLQVQKPLPVCDATRVLLNKNRWRMDLVWPLENGPKHLIAA